MEPQAFRARYGPWALIAGASEGTGAEFARQAAANGLNCALVARRPGPLEALADSLRADHGVEARVISEDLARPGAAQRIAEAVAGLEIGLFISNAGSDSSASLFLDASVEAWRDLVQRNVCTVMESAHAFAVAMKARGRGGIVLMSSGVALGGQPRVAVYSASKAFDLNLGESLWAELGPHGVDVLSVVAPGMNTPTLRRLLESKGLPADDLYEADDVVRQTLARLPEGPTLLFAYGPQADQIADLTQARRARVTAAADYAKRFFGDA